MKRWLVENSSDSGSFSGRSIVAVAIVLLALNLRALVSSVGVLLGEIQADLGMSPTIAGVLTTLPVVYFAIAGVSTHTLIRRLGLHVTTVVCLAAIIVGLVVRSLADGSAMFILATSISLSGAAFGNVALPPLVKFHFPDYVASISAAYGAAIIAGAALASATTAPIAQALGSWRAGLAIWAVLGLIALVPWLPQFTRETRELSQHAVLTWRGVFRSPIAWGLALVLGAQSAQAYAQFGWFPLIMQDAGISKNDAGLLLGLLNGVGIPLTLMLPWLIRISGEKAWLPWGFTGSTISGYAGVFFIPATAPWLWALLLGSGAGAFTWALTMISRRSSTSSTAGVLSSFVQGVGYPIAGLGPFLAGILHDKTGDWSAPIIVLAALMLLVGIGGSLAARHQTIEYDLAGGSI